MLHLFLRHHHSHHPQQKIVLLTGAAGTIGTSLRYLLKEDYHFRCLDV
jgi:uronate dehydrogenase